ncbi:MAG TPA: hypothetical protein VGE34_04705 [Candidatus Saccharimonadales bacterium]
MKKSDIAMIILIIAVSGGLAYALMGVIPGLKLSDEGVKVRTIDRYTSDVPEPDKAIFNKDAINPTVDITIGDASSQSEVNSDNTDTN